MVKQISFGPDSVATLGRLDAGAVTREIEKQDINRLYVLTDENVEEHVAHRFKLGTKLILKPGETTKSIEEWARVSEWLAAQGADRKSAILAIGGGVVTDLAGFVAATYMRGIRWMAIATSLMAQVDAAHGGKTGIDLSAGKNLVGAFHMPAVVWCDPVHLETLPKREMRNGLAEVVKYGFVFDASLLEMLEAPEPDIANVVARCVELKAAVVKADPRETTGQRSVLNFGHTVGHAIESALSYKGILHGEAVMIGMIVEAEIGVRLGLTEESVVSRLRSLAEHIGLPHALPDGLSADTLLPAMRRDKKTSNGLVSMSLIQNVGSCKLVADLDIDIVRGVLDAR